MIFFLFFLDNFEMASLRALPTVCHACRVDGGPSARHLERLTDWEREQRGNFSPLPLAAARKHSGVTSVSLMKELQLLHQPIILVFLYYVEQL